MKTIQIKTLLLSLVICFMGPSISQAQSWTQKGLDIDGELSGNNLGHSVSISSDGNIMAVGIPYRDVDDSLATGQVRVYEWSGSAWVQKGASLNGEGAGDHSGWAIDLSSDGQIIAIGAHYNDAAGFIAGHVRVYEWSGSTWTQKGTDIDGSGPSNLAGRSLCITADGKVLAVGGNGHVRIFEWSGSAWVQKGALIDDPLSYPVFGFSISISQDGNTVAVGATGNSAMTGLVRIFEWSGSAWNQKGTYIDGEGTGDWFGWSVSISADGNTVAIGGPGNDDAGSDAGHVEIYSWSGGAWTQKGIDIDGEMANSSFGYSVSLSPDGNILAIGGNKNSGRGPEAGHVRVYEWSGSTWTQKGSDIDGELSGDHCGYDVEMTPDGNAVVIGSPRSAGTAGPWSIAGQARVFIFDTLSVETHDRNIGGSISIFPNPTHETIEIHGERAQGRYEVVNLSGQIVLQGSVNNDQIQLSSLASGVYLFVIQDETGKIVFWEKLIKQ